MLIITGTMGAGKTTLLGEASEILALRHIAHAAIDLDALGLAHLPSAPGNDGVMYRNLQSVCNNYASLGVRRFLLASAACAQVAARSADVSVPSSVVSSSRNAADA